MSMNRPGDVTRLLEQRYPKLQQTLPFVRLAELPTNLHHARCLGDRLGIGRLLIKRDDQCASSYAGNKIRKLEYLLGGALEDKCDAVLTFGAVGSNHALATAVHARAVGLDCYAVLIHQVMTPNLQRTLRYHALLGTKLLLASGYEDTKTQCRRALNNHPSGSERVAVITWGGAEWLGGVGFVNAAYELSDQVKQAGISPPDHIYLPSGSMGTFATLTLGLRAVGMAARVTGVLVVPQRTFPQQFVDLFGATNRELHARDESFPLFEDPLQGVEYREEFFGDGYGCATPEAEQAIDLMKKYENMQLETTYSGKALAALVADAERGRLKNSTVLFWNTYNSRPYPPELDSVSPGDLPTGFSKYFD